MENKNIIAAKLFQIKVSKKWIYVLAENMQIINRFCEENNYPDWRAVGMLSRAESKEFRKTALVIQ